MYELVDSAIVVPSEKCLANRLKISQKSFGNLTIKLKLAPDQGI